MPRTSKPRAELQIHQVRSLLPHKLRKATSLLNQVEWTFFLNQGSLNRSDLFYMHSINLKTGRINLCEYFCTNSKTWVYSYHLWVGSSPSNFVMTGDFWGNHVWLFVNEAAITPNQTSVLSITIMDIFSDVESKDVAGIRYSRYKWGSTRRIDSKAVQLPCKTRFR
jgi:hypothetical protein